MLTAIALLGLLMGFNLGSNTEHSYLVIEHKDGTVETRLVKDSTDEMAPFRKNSWGEWEVPYRDVDEDF